MTSSGGALPKKFALVGILLEVAVVGIALHPEWLITGVIIAGSALGGWVLGVSDL